MTIQPTGSAGLALYLTARELRSRGMAPEGFTRADALRLTREAAARAGLRLPEQLEIEAYPDPRGVLLLVRSRRVWTPFPDLAAALAAARSGQGGDLLWRAGRWGLSGACPGAGAPPEEVLPADRAGEMQIPEKILAALLYRFPGEQA